MASCSSLQTGHQLSAIQIATSKWKLASGQPTQAVFMHNTDFLLWTPMKIDFPLSLDGSPEPQARLLLDVIELNPEVLRADTGDGLAQEGAILFENRIELGFDFQKLRFFPH